MNSDSDANELVSGTLADHLYGTASLLELSTKLAAGPTSAELAKYKLTKDEWYDQVSIAMNAISRE